MSAQIAWTQFADALYSHNSLELYLDCSRMRLPAERVAALEGELNAAFDAMAALEQGAIANPDEGRMVGHYWLRAPELAPDPTLRSSIEQTVQQVERFADDVLNARVCAPGAQAFTDVVCVGIGGSALGPQLLADALAVPGRGLQMHFVDNTDPAGIARLIARLGEALATTLVLVTSKSGSTAETRNGMLEVRAAMSAGGYDFTSQAVAITGVGSALDEQAQGEGWLARFPMHDWVGGRTSVLSAVGLVPAALAGLNVQALLQGAREMDQATRSPALASNPAAQLALAWHITGDGAGKRDMVVLPYKDSLLLFSRYLQQLVMESLGKGTNLDGQPVHQGIAVYGNKGSTDQHAYVQQLREGLDNFFVTFVEVLEHTGDHVIEVEPGVSSGDYLSGFLHGTREALDDNGRPSMTITIARVDERHLAGLIALYERAVGLYASLVNINAYHQPGVEAGKKAAGERLALQARVLDALRAAPGERFALDSLATAAGAGENIEAVYQIVRQLAANKRRITLHGERHAPARLQVEYRP